MNNKQNFLLWAELRIYMIRIRPNRCPF